MQFSTRSLLHGDVHVGEGEYLMPVIGIFVILFLGLSGSLIPPLIGLYMPKLDINRRLTFRFFNGLAAGVVLGVAYVHAIPDSIESFETAMEGKEGKTAEYGWGGLVTMVGSLLTFLCEEFVHRKIGRFAALHGHDHGHGHGHHHHGEKKDDDKKEGGEEYKPATLTESRQVLAESASNSSASSSSSSSIPSPSSMEEGSAASNVKDLDVVVSAVDSECGEMSETQVGYYTELYVLLFGLSFHSIFVGIALGVSGDDWGLFAAIVFHQFFEGLALGARVARAGFKKKAHIWILDIIYALAIPVGIAIGIGIQSALVHEPITYSVVNGVFQGLSGGVLIYVALIHMMKEEMARPEFKEGGPLLYVMYIGFFVGAGCLAVIGIWA